MALRLFFRSRISSATVVAASMKRLLLFYQSGFTSLIIRAMKVLLVSTYDLGRQPFGLASPAAWLRADGHQVTLADLSRPPLPASSAGEANLIAFFLPMHTATRLALPVVERMRARSFAPMGCTRR